MGLEKKAGEMKQSHSIALKAQECHGSLNSLSSSCELQSGLFAIAATVLLMAHCKMIH